MDRKAPVLGREELEEFRRRRRNFTRAISQRMTTRGTPADTAATPRRAGTAACSACAWPAAASRRTSFSLSQRGIEKHGVKKVHFTTCQTIQLHDLDADAVCDIMAGAMEHDIVTLGGGGDFPRNVMAPPLSGTQKGEYFDVLPYAKKAEVFLLTFLDVRKMPRKLKVCFSTGPANVTHATFRDLGFVARPDGMFDV